MKLNEPERQRIPARRQNEDPSKAQRFPAEGTVMFASAAGMNTEQ